MMQQMALQQQQKNQNNSAKYINFKCFNVCKFEAEMKRTKTKATNNKTQKKICKYKETSSDFIHWCFRVIAKDGRQQICVYGSINLCSFWPVFFLLFWFIAKWFSCTFSFIYFFCCFIMFKAAGRTGIKKSYRIEFGSFSICCPFLDRIIKCHFICTVD